MTSVSAAMTMNISQPSEQASPYWLLPPNAVSYMRILIKYRQSFGPRPTGKTVYILDEPTTGLHIADVHKLVEVLQKLVDGGNTVIVIEHNLDLIKCADHIIDLGPEGGSAGGLIIAEGTPEQVAEVPGSFTGQYLKPLLEKDKALRQAAQQ